MAIRPMAVHERAPIPAEVFHPFDSPKAVLEPLDARLERLTAQLASALQVTAPTTPLSKAPAHADSSRHVVPQASHRTPPIASATDITTSDREGEKGMDAQPPLSLTPPPVPPKSPTTQDRSKSVSILVPTEISPGRGYFSHSQSEVGHSYRTTVNGAVSSPESAPAPGRILTSPHVVATASPDVSLSSSKASYACPSIEPSMRKPSSVRTRRNKLHKARQHSLPSAPLGSSLFSSLLSRAFGSHDSSRGHSGSNINPSMSNRSYRPMRSVSDGGRVVTQRPTPSSRNSGATDSSCTTSSSSTALSYASTALTTPDSTSPPLSPRNSTKSGRANKLHKRRPPLAPSSYQYPPGAQATALGRSKSTPTGLGQRPERSKDWSSVEEARHAAEEAEALEYGPDPTSWYTSSTDLSPSRRSTLDPILEVRRKGSSHALAELACTGLCSTSVAALSSQLALQSDLSECQSTLNGHSWDENGAELFNPYMECSSPQALVNGAPDARAGHEPSPPSAESSSASSSSSPQTGSPSNADEPSSGFAVVSGYLDRSEDAMRRWTLAMADVPDEILVQHLERLRKESMALARGRLPGRRSAAPSQIGHGDEDSTLETRDRRSSFFFGGPREMGISPRSPSRTRFSVGHFDRDMDGDNSDDEALSDEDDEEDWKTARQVLFCCRELVQTERNYQARLRELSAAELSPHYASLVARHVPALLSVSETLLAHFVDDPSAWGVSAAFIGCEEDLETAFVAWSGVVGEFFAEDANLKPTRKLTKKLTDDTSNHGHDSPAPSMRISMRTRSHTGIASPKGNATINRRISSTMSDVGHGETSSSIGHGSGMFIAALGTGLGFGLSIPPSPSPFDPEVSPVKPSQARSLHGHGRRANASTISGLGLSRAITVANAWKRKSMPSSLSNLPNLVSSPTSPASPHSPSHAHGYHHHHHSHNHHSSSASAHGHGKKYSEHDAKMSVREMAIQPTQRVMRYVLQYRDLLDHTPTTSPSRALVERAYEIALRIAKKCDRAQAHAAFVRHQHQK